MNENAGEAYRQSFTLRGVGQLACGYIARNRYSYCSAKLFAVRIPPTKSGFKCGGDKIRTMLAVPQRHHAYMQSAMPATQFTRHHILHRSLYNVAQTQQSLLASAASTTMQSIIKHKIVAL